MKDCPLISIITVTYNAEATLERTLHSIEAQTYPHIEHILIDGCSTDHTMSHIQRYVERNGGKSRTIRVIREPDNGLYDAMNKGIQQATGDYLVFLNAGDRLHEPTTIEHLAARSDWQRGRVNYAVLYGETDLVDDGGNFLRHRRLRAPENPSAAACLSATRVSTSVQTWQRLPLTTYAIAILPITTGASALCSVPRSVACASSTPTSSLPIT